MAKKDAATAEVVATVPEQGDAETEILEDEEGKEEQDQGRDQDSAVREEWEKAKIVMIRNSRGGQVKLAYIESNMPGLTYLAFSKENRVGILVLKDENGNVQIMTNRFLRHVLGDLDEVCNILNEIDPPTREGDPLKWFFNLKYWAAFNGTRNIGREPTGLTTDKIVTAVRIAVDTSLFFTDKAKTSPCRDGVCTSSHSAHCPWWRWHLRRCMGIRPERSDSEFHGRDDGRDNTRDERQSHDGNGATREWKGKQGIRRQIVINL